MAELAREDAPAAVIPSPRIVHGTGGFRAAGARVVGRRGATARDARGGRGSIVQSSLILVPTRVSRGNRRTPIVLKLRQSPRAQKSKKKREVLLGISERFKTPSNPGCQNQNLKSVLEPFTVRLTN